MPIRIDRDAAALADGTALPMLAILGSIVSLCVGASLARTLFPSAGVAGTTAYRTGFAALMLLALWRPWRVRAGAAHWRRVALFGLVLGAMNLTFYAALRTVPLGVAIALEFVGPLAVSIAGSRRPVDFAWIGCAVLGVGLLLPLWQFSAGLDPLGVMFALLAGGCWAAYILLGRRLGRTHPGPSLAIGMSTAALFTLPFAMAGAGADLLAPSLLVTGLALGVLSSLVPFSLEMYALGRLAPATFSVLLSLEPAVGALAGWLMSGDRLDGVQWFAIGCVVVACAGKALGASKARADG